MIRLDIDMPLGCIYEKNGKTEYCPLCNHYDVPFCQFLDDDDEAEIGIDERPCYCPLSAEQEHTQFDCDMAYMQGKTDGIRECTERLRKLKIKMEVDNDIPR